MIDYGYGIPVQVGNTYVWSGPAPDVIDSDYLAEMSAIVIREAAKLGRCVIVGRGAQCVLQGRDDVFHVFVYGSRPEKLKRIQTRYPSPTECARGIRPCPLGVCSSVLQV